MKQKLFLLLALCMMSIGIAVAQTTVKGIVVQKTDGEPIIGATVLVKGTTTGAISDVDGKFEIKNVPASAKSLQVSYIGMRTVEVAIAPNVTIQLESESALLDDVIVVAYGTAKKSSFTGSASAIGQQVLDKRALTNVTNALEGNAPGVQIAAASGQPGESASIRIRGFGSANASNEPLYVVDGAIYDGKIGDINPMDIESITVLKDAASTSLYGSSAGNGVVLITTKKGSSDNDTHLTLTVNQGWNSRAYDDYAKVDAMAYYPLQWEMLKNSYITAGKSATDAAQLASDGIFSKLKYNPFVGVDNKAIVGVDGKLNSSANTLKWGDDLNWEDAAFRTGHRQEYALGYSTRTAKSDTYASLSYLNDQGYMIKTDFERYSARVNYNIYPNKYIKSGINASFNRVSSNYSTSTSGSSSSYSNLTRFVRNMSPIYPVHAHDLNTGAYLDSDGNPTTDPSKYIYDWNGSRVCDAGRDAVAETIFNNREINRTGQSLRTYLTVTPIDGLNITANYSLDNSDNRRKVYENPWVGDGTAGPARLNILSTRTLTQTFNQLISYTKSFGNNNIDAMIGHESYSYKYEYMYSMKVGETVNGIYDFENFTSISSLSSYTDEYKKESWFGRLNYDYANRYYASFSYRRDGSSRFSKDNRWGNFFSVGASWRASEEAFLKDVKWIDNLKLRASWGQTGNDHILNGDGDTDYYPYMTLYGLGYTNGTEAGAFFTTIANSNLKWESQVSTDVGLEFGFFNRLSGTVEWFNKASNDLLFDVSQPYSTGVTSIVQNIGKISNYGVEVDLNYDAVKSKNWKFSVGLNATFLKNKIDKLPDTMQDGYVSGSKKWLVGKSIYEFWLYQWAGVDPATGNGLYILDPENKKSAEGTIVSYNGQECTSDYNYALKDFSGTTIPTVMGGFNFKLQWKDIDFAATFSYQLGGKLLDSNYARMMSMSEYGYSMSPDLNKAWRQAGDITDVPRIDNNATHASNIGQSYSTRWLTSSDYLNLRSVSLGYNLPKNFIKKAFLKSARINLTAENLFLIKARQGLNPMAQYNGLTYNEYMPDRKITIGVNLSF